jgi:cytochrome c biogenesis protein CcmG, thiol:disulfide interchange protein DsbE
MKRAVWALVVAVPLVALLAAGFGRDPSVVASPLLNKPAPAFALQSIDGKPVSLESLHGKVVVLNFWASWCTSCRAEHGYLLDADRAYGSKGVALIGVMYQDSASAARSFLQQYGGGWPVVNDPGQRTAVDYGVIAVPETYFIDRRGIIRYKSAGPVTPDLLTRQLTRLTGKQT